MSGPDDAAHGYGVLLDHARRQAQGGGDVSVESLCAIEQLLADLALLPGDFLVGSLGSLRSTLGDAPDAGPPFDILPEVSVLRERLWDVWQLMSPEERRDFLRSPGTSPRWADCMAHNPIDFTRYERAAVEATRLEPPSSHLVIGIRTAGSYLAPAWTRALRSLGSPARYLTVRPRRHADGAITVPDLPGEADFAGVRDVLLVDDGFFSGKTLQTVEQRVREVLPAGVRLRSSVYFVGDARGRERLAAHGSSTPIVLSGCQRTLPFFAGTGPREFLADAVTELGPFTLADEPPRTCDPGYWQSYVRASVDVGTHVLDGLDHRIRKRRYRLVVNHADGRRIDVVAKYVGWGALAVEEGRVLRECFYGDAVIGVASGYLFCRWSEGDPVAFRGGRRWSPQQVRSLAANGVALYFARASRTADAGEWADRRAKTVRRWGRLSTEFSESIARISADAHAFPVITLPRNQGHWHHVRTGDGEVRRFHQDAGRWSRVADPAWDLASVILELGLDIEQARLLVGEYRDATGDRSVADRLPLAVAEYGISLLAEYEEHHREIAAVPHRFHRRDRAGIAPFAERLRGVLSAVGPWVGLPDHPPLRLPSPIAEGLAP